MAIETYINRWIETIHKRDELWGIILPPEEEHDVHYVEWCLGQWNNVPSQTTIQSVGLELLSYFSTHVEYHLWKKIFDKTVLLWGQYHAITKGTDYVMDNMRFRIKGNNDITCSKDYIYDITRVPDTSNAFRYICNSLMKVADFPLRKEYSMKREFTTWAWRINNHETLQFREQKTETGISWFSIHWIWELTDTQLFAEKEWKVWCSRCL